MSRLPNPVLFTLFFFFNDTATTEIYTLSLHDALPISAPALPQRQHDRHDRGSVLRHGPRRDGGYRGGADLGHPVGGPDGQGSRRHGPRYPGGNVHLRPAYPPISATRRPSPHPPYAPAHKRL